MISRKLYKVSIFIYVVSLLLPIHGVWFGGAIMMFVSVFGAIIVIAAVGSEAIRSAEGVLGLFGMLLPFSNIIFICCVVRFKNLYALLTPSTILLFLFTAISFCMAIVIVFQRGWEFYSFVIWSLSFVLLTIAIIIRWCGR